MQPWTGDERGVTEATGVAILVGMTVIVTATVGLNVLVVAEDDTGPNANFSYDHVEENSVLIVTHVRGDEFPAGDLVIEGPDEQTTWAATASVNESSPVGPGDVTQLSKNNAYGDFVRTSTPITIYYDRDGNRTRLSRWPQE